MEATEIRDMRNEAFQYERQALAASNREWYGRVVKALDRCDLLDKMMKDLLDAVGQFYGPEGLGKVVEHMKRANEARDDNAEIDALMKIIEPRSTS